MEAKHTPGPWELAIGEQYCFHEGNRIAIVGHVIDLGEEQEFTIAEVWPTTEDAQAEADGCLIASSPELLEALEACYAERGMFVHQGAAELARAAIAKARGEQVNA